MGDVGEKLGYNAIDNGYLMFDNVRVSRKSHLSRFSEITREGEFELKSDPRRLYMIMSKTRLSIIQGSAYALLYGALVSTRYAVCRRQFSNQTGTKEERKLLDYQVHMELLGKNVGNAAAIFLIGRVIDDFFQ